jgi:DNA processing protein
VPGSPLDPRAEGSNDLIKQGAAVATGAADVVDVLRPILGGPAAPPLAVAEPEALPAPDAELEADGRARIIALLGPTPVAIDDLVRLSESTPASVRVALLELELAGRLDRHGGALVSLT